MYYYQCNKKVSPYTQADIPCSLESFSNFYQNTLGNSGMIVWWRNTIGYYKTTTSLLFLDSTTTTPPVQKPFNPTVAAPYVDTNYMTYDNATIFMILYSGVINGNVNVNDISIWVDGICYNNVFYEYKTVTHNIYAVHEVENVYLQFNKKVSPRSQGDVWCGF